MLNKILWWIVKKCVCIIDRDNLLMVYSFAKDDVTDYHLVVERCLPDVHMYGTHTEHYRKSEIYKKQESEKGYAGWKRRNMNSASGAAED